MPAPSPAPSPSAAPPAGAAPLPARLGDAGPKRPVVSSECLAQIEAVAEIYSGNRVMLGQAAFADSDQLVLTRMARRSQDGKLLDGRAAAEQPVVLNLLRDTQGCTIRIVGAPDTRLPACTCTPLRP